MTELATITTGGGCGCHDRDEAEAPTLDARVLPPALRHGAIHGALSSVQPGASMILVAPRDPIPLLDELAQREPEAFEVSYLERGPDQWRLLLTRSS